LIWHVDNLTGTLTVKIPFPTTPQGGRGPKVPFWMVYNSASTVTLQSSGSDYVPGFIPDTVTTTVQTFTWAPGWINPLSAIGPVGPWTTSGSFTTIGSTQIPTIQNPSGTQYGCQVLGPYSYTAPDGASYELNILAGGNSPGESSAPGCTFTPILSSATTDGSALLTSLTNGVVYPDGATDSNGALEDTNGNEAQLAQNGSNFTGVDSEKRQAFSTTIPVDYKGAMPAGTYTLTTAGAAGQSETYTVTFTNASIGTFTMPHPVNKGGGTSGNLPDFDCTGTGAVCITNQPTAGANVSFLTSIALPDDQSSYKFIPDSTYGTISMITFPTGGYVRFCYGVRSVGSFINQLFNNMSTIAVTDVFLSAEGGSNPSASACQTPQTGENHWHYSDPALTSSASITNTVVAPDGTSTQYTGIPWVPGGLTQYWGGHAPTWLETQRVVSSSKGAIVQSVSTSYDAIVGSLPAQVTTTLYDAGSPLQEQVQYKYDNYSNVIEKDESGFYSCSGSPCAVAATPPSGWMRKTFTTYEYQSKSSWLTSHIVNKPSQVLVTDGAAHPYSLTVYGYDESNTVGPTGYTNHDDKNYPAGAIGLPRGNVTSEHRCARLASSMTVTPQNASTACGNWLVTTHVYDLAGQRTSTIDPNGNMTSFSYADSYVDGSSSAATDAYVTTITYPNAATDAYTYFYSTGQAATHKDWNSQTTSYGYADNLNRIKLITDPVTVDGTNGAGGASAAGSTSYSYDDNPGAFSVTASALMTGTTSLTKSTNYDGLGRTQSTQLMNAIPGGAANVSTTYDSLGRVFSVSNSYYSPSDPTYGLTYYCYDAIGRKVLQVQPDNSGGAPTCGTTTAFTSAQQWSYQANSTVQFQDENGNQWQRTTDALGRLTKVLEPSGSSKSASLETDYSYDLLDNLTAVSQCGAACPASNAVNRQFSYDSLSRLIQSFNPEAGWTCYGTSGGAAPNGSNCTSGYDGDSNLLSKTDARGVVIGYLYDTLNRLLSKTYSSDGNKTPSSCFQYDSTSVTNGKGHLSSEWTQSASAGACASTPPSTGLWSRRSILAYDAMGRILSEQQCTPYNCSSGTPYAPAYTYNLAGNPIGATNGITTTPVVNTLSLTNLIDAAGRQQGVLSNWVDATHPSSLYSAQTATAAACSGSQLYPFAPFGSLLNATYGAGLTLNRSYDVRLRTTCENDTGSLLTNSTPASATVTLTGQEQSK
jgi:YD repeat-containing protein